MSQPATLHKAHGIHRRPIIPSSRRNFVRSPLVPRRLQFPAAASGEVHAQDHGKTHRTANLRLQVCDAADSESTEGGRQLGFARARASDSHRFLQQAPRSAAAARKQWPTGHHGSPTSDAVRRDTVGDDDAANSCRGAQSSGLEGREVSSSCYGGCGDSSVARMATGSSWRRRGLAGGKDGSFVSRGVEGPATKIETWHQEAEDVAEA